MTNEELAFRIRNGERELELKLWAQIKGFAIVTANKWLNAFFSRSDVEFDDLMSSAYIAMLSAVKSYNDDRAKFLTLYSYCLRTEFSTTYGIRTKKQLKDPLNNSLSLDAPATPDGDNKATLGDIYIDPTDITPSELVEEDVYNSELRQALDGALLHIPLEYGDVLKRYYFRTESLQSIAESKGNTLKQIQQIKQNGLNALRHPSIRSKLLPYFDFDYYRGTSAASFKASGMSIQEQYLCKFERDQSKLLYSTSYYR